MRRLLKWLAGIAAVFVGLMVLVAVGLYIATFGDYPVPATVTDDPDLPARDILGVRLHAESYGPEGGPAVIVLHGGPGDDYRSQLPLAALADDGYQVFFYDQRGAGLSERLPAEGLTLATHLAELDAIADALSPGVPVSLIGHSWGGMLASAYLGAHPDRVARAVLIEPGFLSADEGEAYMAAFGDRMKSLLTEPAVLWKFLVIKFQALHIDGPDGDAAADYANLAVAHLGANHPDNPFHCPGKLYDGPTWRNGSRAGPAVQSQATHDELDSFGAVDAFTGPVLVVSGGCDSWLGGPPQEAHAALFANGEHISVPDAGHDVVDDQPEAALTMIRDFLR